MAKTPEQFLAIERVCIVLANTASRTEERKEFADHAAKWLKLAADAENQPIAEIATPKG
jgi:hypothetical protein